MTPIFITLIWNAERFPKNCNTSLPGRQPFGAMIVSECLILSLLFQLYRYFNIYLTHFMPSSISISPENIGKPEVSFSALKNELKNPGQVLFGNSTLFKHV